MTSFAAQMEMELAKPSTWTPQTEFICPSVSAPDEGAVFTDGYRVIEITHEFPEQGFSYDDMREGKCRAYVRVVLRRDE